MTSPDRRAASDELSSADRSNMVELHLAAPKATSRGDLLRHHITTRNFFAWVCSKPLVGHALGQALSDLLERMALYRSQNVDNIEDILVYADDMGYSHVDCCPDHALAMLYFSESHRLSYVWTDAFAHCVGMNDELSTSPEFDHVCQVTKALITRAYIEMDLHITRATRALSDFLQDDLSDAHLGLSIPARAHLDTFRSFLLSYHVDAYGYWPPSTDNHFPKHVFWQMYEEFQALYTFMADPKSSHSQPSSPVSGGLCVFQNLEAFNTRHKFPSLPHSQPNLPRSAIGQSNSTRDSLRRFALSRNQRSSAEVPQVMEDPAVKVDRKVLLSPLVQRYRQFDVSLDTLMRNRITSVEACKVRWIMVYSILQTVRSIVISVKEVRASDAPYPLCVLTAGLPTWKSAGSTRSSAPAKPVEEENDNHSRTRPSTSLDIHPDCETETDFIKPLHTYATPRPKSRSTSIRSQSSIEILSRLPSSISLSMRRASVSKTKSRKSRDSAGSKRSNRSSVRSPRDLSDGLVPHEALSATSSRRSTADLSDGLLPDEALRSPTSVPPQLGITRSSPAQAEAPQPLPSDMLDVDMLLPLPSPAAEEEHDEERYLACQEPEIFEAPLLSGEHAETETPRVGTSPQRPVSSRPLSSRLGQPLPKLDTGMAMTVQPASSRSPTLDDSNLFPPDEYEMAGFSSADESAEDPPSLNWSSQSHSPGLPRSSGIRNSEDVMSIPSVAPGMPPTIPAPSSPQRMSAGFFSSLRSSRTLSTNYSSRPSDRSSQSTTSQSLPFRYSMKDSGSLSPDLTPRFEHVHITRQYSGSHNHDAHTLPSYDDD